MIYSLTQPRFTENCDQAVYLCDNQGDGTVYVVRFADHDGDRAVEIFRWKTTIPTYEIDIHLNDYFANPDSWVPDEPFYALVKTEYDYTSYGSDALGNRLTLSDDFVKDIILSDIRSRQSCEFRRSFN